MLQRSHMAIGPTDTGGTYTDTGPFITGAIRQIHWHPNDPGDTGTVFDTGGDLKIELLVGASAADTGATLVLLNDNDCLGATFFKAPVQGRVRADGFDTGTGAAIGAPVYAVSDQYRVTVTPGGRRVLGNLWIVTEHDYD